MCSDPGERCFTRAYCAFGMRVQSVGAHLDEHAGPVLNMLTEEFDREVLRLDEEGIATLRALRSDARLQPLRTVDLPLSRACLCSGFLLCQPLTHGIAQMQVTREVHRVHSCE